MRTLRCAVLAAGLLVACASSGVQLQSPQSSFPTAQKVLLAIAKEHGYTVGYPVQKLPQAGQRPNRALLRVTMPDAGGGEALVYTVEANDIYGHLLVWAADAACARRSARRGCRSRSSAARGRRWSAADHEAPSGHFPRFGDAVRCRRRNSEGGRDSAALCRHHARGT
jgi:hypothetical protein